MMNHIILVGTVEGAYKVVLEGGTNRNKLIEFNLMTEKPYVSKTNPHQKNIFKIKVWSNNVEDPQSSLGDQELVCIRGHMNSFSYKNKQGETSYFPEIYAEKLTNLSMYA